MEDPQQRALLQRARAGDSAACGLLLEGYRAYLRALVHCAGERLRSRLSTSDLVQEALLEAHRCFSQFLGTTPAELTAWLRQIALRVAGRALRNHLDVAGRAVGREVPVSGELLDSRPGPDLGAEQAERAALLAAAMTKLPGDFQEVLMARHVEDLSYADLAVRTGRSEGALRVLYTRALRRLREECGRTGVNE